MYTIREAIEKLYDKNKDYKAVVAEYYKDSEGIEIEDEQAILWALEDLAAGEVQQVVDSLQGYDTEVREVFVRLMKGTLL